MDGRQHLIVLICNLYSGQEATVRPEQEEIEWFPLAKAVMQTCILSPCLFSLYAEHIRQKGGLDFD